MTQFDGIFREISDGRPGRRYVLVKVLDPNGRFLPINRETGAPDEDRRYELVKRYVREAPTA